MGQLFVVCKIMLKFATALKLKTMTSGSPTPLCITHKGLVKETISN